VAYKKEILEIIFKHAKSVVFIDHHVSISEDVQELQKLYNTNNNIQIVYDSERCGSTLAWSFLHGDEKPMPLFLKYVEDQDTGHWIHPKTKPFIYAVRVYFSLSTEPKNMNRWKTLIDRENVAKLVKKGEYMKRYNDLIVSINIPKHSLQKFPSKKIYDMNPNIFKKPGQYTVAVYCGHNCPSVTELGVGALEKMPNIDFCIMWVYNIDSKKYILSMRSKNVDISEICKIFGGGGHKLAAACSFNGSVMKIDDVFEGASLTRTLEN
jgi:oligoribonuclease NrnB/cAMP/cGMP phosphodiesterase (DHH superfamily)